jgi:hypothetical protein
MSIGQQRAEDSACKAGASPAGSGNRSGRPTTGTPHRSARHADVLEVTLLLQCVVAEARPFSLVRLGDGEGRLLGYPEIVGQAELDISLQIWFGRTDFAPDALAALAVELREATLAADLLGLPRPSQLALPEYRAVFAPLERFGLLARGPLLTDSAIHRYLQIGLFYRELLADLPFCGLVSCRDLASQMKRVFRLGRVEQYLVPGEAQYPGPRPGEHYPGRFQELRETLTVPFPGAVFLVGAGALGKIYCHWIKQRGGIALDIGAVCDAWGGVGRLRKPCHGLQVYDEVPPLTRAAAVRHYNEMIVRDRLRIDPLPVD